MTVRERWRALPRFGRGILAALALMAVGFGAAMLVLQTRLSPLCEPGGQLVPRREGEVLRYSGQIDGGQAELTIRPDGLAEYRWEELDYGPYELERWESGAPDPGPYQGAGARWVTIRQGDRVLFQGGYDPAAKNGLFTLVADGGMPMGENGRAPTEDGDARRAEHAPRLTVLCQAALRDELRRGDWMCYGALLLASLLLAAWVVFRREIFALRAALWVRAPEGAEPSETYLRAERALWAALTAVLLALYAAALFRVA